MRRTLPARTISVLARQVHHKLFQSLLDRQEAAVQHSGVEMSVSALFNGVIRDELPDKSAWTTAYQAEPICVQMKKWLQTSNIDTNTINTIHCVYPAPMRKGQIKWKDQGLILIERIASTLKNVELVIVPAIGSLTAYIPFLSHKPTRWSLLTILYTSSTSTSFSLAWHVYKHEAMDRLLCSMRATKQLHQIGQQIVVFISDLGTYGMHPRRRLGTRQDHLLQRICWPYDCCCVSHDRICRRRGSHSAI
jgi:hypothetical protein